MARKPGQRGSQVTADGYLHRRESVCSRFDVESEKLVKMNKDELKNLLRDYVSVLERACGQLHQVVADPQ